MDREEKKQIEEAGYKAFEPGQKWDYIYKNSPYKKESGRKSAFERGYAGALNEWESSKLEPFFKELDALCLKYKAYISCSEEYGEIGMETVRGRYMSFPR